MQKKTTTKYEETLVWLDTNVAVQKKLNTFL